MQNEFSYKIFSVKNLDHTEVLVWTAHAQNRLVWEFVWITTSNFMDDYFEDSASQYMKFSCKFFKSLKTLFEVQRF